jgi:hypothetical protein
MSVSITRFLLCWAMVVIVPVSLLGQTSSAILHTQGGVWVNGYEANDSVAIFSGDTVEAKTGFSANLTLEGSEVLIQQVSVTKFQGDFIELDHGGVLVGTSKSFKVKVHCITVVPVTNDWTQYEVTDVNGTVDVAARKSDVNVEIRRGGEKPVETTDSQKASVHEGEQRSYHESEVCGAAKPPEPASGFNTKWIAIGGAAAGGIVLLCVLALCNGTKGQPQPVSASQP